MRRWCCDRLVTSVNGRALTRNLSAYADRPIAFFVRYVRAHRLAHAVILACVATAVLCSVMTQYGVKLLIDTLSQASPAATAVWLAFGLLVALIAADNLLWRLASWVGHATFVAVTGDARRDLFRHLTGHAPSYFASRSPGTLTSCITATSNALLRSRTCWCGTCFPMPDRLRHRFVAMVSWWMAASLVVAGGMVVAAFCRAVAGKPCTRVRRRAAAVDGEMTDVGMTIVRALAVWPRAPGA
jgi:ATP-binding cassette subfamily B protein